MDTTKERITIIDYVIMRQQSNLKTIDIGCIEEQNTNQIITESSQKS